MAEPEDRNLFKEVVGSLNKKPAKGILKNSSSFETAESIKWYFLFTHVII